MSQSENQPTPKVLRDLRAFLREINVVALATVDEQGRPYVANIYVAPDEAFCFYFVSDRQSAHVHHIARQPRVALAGYAPIRMWQQVRGIQIQGACAKVAPEQRDEAWSIYHRKFPHIDDVAESIRTMDFYRITPDSIRWIDNSVHFGFQIDLTWPLPQATPSQSERHGFV